MTRSNKCRLLTAILLACTTSVLSAQEKVEAPKDVVVLNNKTRFRTFWVFRTPVVVKANGEFTPAMIPGGKKPTKIKDYQSPMPDPTWHTVEFDDLEWSRAGLPVEKDKGQLSGRNPRALHTATPNSILCARTRFVVDDPGKVGDLTLNLEYVGGVVVFLNGKEVLRQSLPAGELKPETLADRYPDDLYVLPNGKFQREEEWNPELFRRRYRHVKDAVIPARLLRKGTNVLALQLHRSPVNEAAALSKRDVYSGMYRMPGLWSYVAFHGIALTASPGAAVKPNTGRPSGVQVWNCGPHASLDLNSYGDPRATPAPITINAARNGTFSGRLVLSSRDTIEDIKVSLSPLAMAGGGSKLPADHVRLRYGRRALASESLRGAMRFDGLHHEIPSRVEKAKLSVRRVIKRGRKHTYDNYAGAVLPLWITVRPPKDAKPGRYDGVLTVEAKGLAKTDVPVHCTVWGWTMPDPVDYRVKQLPVFSPYSLALHYKVPFWSDEHFALAAKSFRLMSEINARRVDLDLAVAVRTRKPFGIEHSMFRLVPKKDGNGYTYDFSIIEKLFDTIEQTMKAPLPLQVNCWGDNWAKKPEDRKKWFTAGRVPVLDPETGKLKAIPNPPPGSEESFTFWKPILDELRKRIEERGWWKATAIGHQSYCWAPAPEQVDIARRIWPDAVWNYSSHAGRLGGVFKGTKGLRMPILYSECVWTAGKHAHRGYRRLLAKGREKSIWNYSCRDMHHDDSPLTTLLHFPEVLNIRGHDGLGYLCADFLQIPHPSRKDRYYQLDTKSGNIIGSSTRSFLAGGPDGPLATGRYEAFRAGVQRCEAVFYLQRCLDAKSIDGELAKRVNALLDNRSTMINTGWYKHNGLAQEDRDLYALAAEVEAAVKP